jgi:hypothetical protein
MGNVSILPECWQDRKAFLVDHTGLSTVYTGVEKLVKEKCS